MMSLEKGVRGLLMLKTAHIKYVFSFFMSHVFVITTAVHQVSTEEDFLLSFDFKVRILRIKSEF